MSLLTAFLASAPPDAAIEIAAESVTVAVSGGARGGQLTLASSAIEPLPAGALTPSLTGANVADRAAVSAAVAAALGRLGSRPKRVALLVPDSITRVSLVRFDQVPAGRGDLDQLIRWQLKKSAPFPLEEASVTYVPGAATPEGGREFLVALARREAVREYEAVCEDAGLHPGIVDLATFGVVNCVMAGGPVPSGDWLVVHVRPDYTSIVIMRGTDVIFFRNRAEGDGDSLSELVHQTAMYYQDRLSGRGFSRVLVGGAGRAAGELDAARRDLAQRLGLGSAVESIDVMRATQLADRLTPPADLQARLAPLVGALMRAHRVTVAA